MERSSKHNFQGFYRCGDHPKKLQKKFEPDLAEKPAQITQKTI